MLCIYLVASYTPYDTKCYTRTIHIYSYYTIYALIQQPTIYAHTP